MYKCSNYNSFTWTGHNQTLILFLVATQRVENCVPDVPVKWQTEHDPLPLLLPKTLGKT